MSLTLGHLVQGGGQRDQSYLDVYANQFRVGMTPSDFTLIFGATEDYGPSVGIKDRVAIRVAPSTLKLMVLTLQNTLTVYEELIGAIPITQESQELIAANRAQLAQSMRAMQAQMAAAVAAARDANPSAPNASPPPP